MIRLPRVFALGMVVVAPTLHAQQADYVPSYELKAGREIVAVYVGASTCGPCQNPGVKAAVRSMKGLVAAQAKKQGASFQAVAAANDWELPKATAFLEPLGAFDQVSLGGNWTNLAIEQFVLRDSTTQMAMPQILVFERTITVGTRVSVSEPHVLRRIVGSGPIPLWVAAGAPIDPPETSKPRQ